MRSVVEKVTPAKAKKWLEKNLNNRAISDTKVTEYQSAIERGEWQLTHQGIALDSTGNIVDGQHRLWAIFYSGMTVELLVTYDAPAETKSVIDVGRKRTASDVLAMRGEVSTHAIAGALRILDGYWRGFDVMRKKPMSHDQMLELLDLNPGIREAVKEGAAIASRTGMTISPAAAGTYLVMFEADYGNWQRGLINSVGLYDKDPRTALKNAQLNALRSRRKRSPEWQLGLFGKAWVAFKAGRSYTSLAFKDAEPMPIFGSMKHMLPSKE